MARLPIGSWTVEQFISYVNAELKNYTKKDWTKKLTREMINIILMEYYALSGIKDDPKYREKVVIPKIATVSSNINAGAGFVASTRLLTIPSSGGGIVWDGATSFNSLFAGAKVKLQVMSEFAGSEGDAAVGSSQPTNTYNTTVEEVINSTTVKLVSATIPNISGATLKALVTATSEIDEVYIGNLDNYKSIDRILTITSSEVAGVCHMVDDSSEFHYIKGVPTSANVYSEEIVCYRRGEYIDFFKGGDVDSYGLREMEYTRFPRKATADSDYIDISDTNLRMLMDMLEIKMLQTIKDQPMPNELLSTQGKLAEMKKSVAEEKALLKAK